MSGQIRTVHKQDPDFLQYLLANPMHCV